VTLPSLLERQTQAPAWISLLSSARCASGLFIEKLKAIFDEGNMKIFLSRVNILTSYDFSEHANNMRND
jgi:hypothetical protein